MPCCCLSVTPGFIWGNQMCKRRVVCLLIYVCLCFLFFWVTLSLHPHPHFAADCLMSFPVTDAGEEKEEEGILLTPVLRLLASFICGMWNFLSLSPYAFMQGFPVSAGGVCRSKVKPTVTPNTCQATVATPFLSSPLRLSRMAPLGTASVKAFFF